MLQYLPPLAGVVILSILITRMLIPVSHVVGLLDRPTDRKTHTGSIPLIGGISIYLTVVISSAVYLHLNETFIGVGIICGLVTLMGAIDDRYPVQPPYRLVVQLIAGAAIAGLGIKIISLGNLLGLGDVSLSVIAIPFTAIAITGLCNAYNMVDGIDGLAGSLTLISMTSLLYLALGRAPDNEVALLAFLCTSISIFLLFNLTISPFFKRKIFMGDAGSTFLGCSVAIAMVHFSQSDRAIVSPATTLWLTAIPLMDMLSTMLRRVLKGQSPLHADRTHLHHILMRGGLGQRQALLCIIVVSAACAGAGIVLARVWPQNEAISFGLWLVMLGIYFKFVVKHAFKFVQGLRRFSVKGSS